jgi:hypothetical protein
MPKQRIPQAYFRIPPLEASGYTGPKEHKEGDIVTHTATRTAKRIGIIIFIGIGLGLIWFLITYPPAW